MNTSLKDRNLAIARPFGFAVVFASGPSGGAAEEAAP
jgi:hypothetical protein